jgi:hypothetical protein
MNPLETDREHRVDAVVADYLDRIDRGEQVDRESLLDLHADLADELRIYFDAAELVDRMAGPTLAEHERVIASQDTSKPGRIEATIGETRTAGATAIDRHDPLPKVLGRYAIDKPLGQGAMGSVYLARDTMLNRPVALKIPKIGEGEEVALMDRFHREAQAAAALRNPHICPVYDFGEIEGVHYITMAYIEGAPLSRLLASEPLSQRQIAELVRKLALALEETHAQGVIHRDLSRATS